MYEYIVGKIVNLTPTYLIIENQNIGFFLNITLNTYTKLQVDTIEKIYTHLQIREDAHILYGFKEEKEREMFRLLITVSGIGSNTSRMILSSLTVDELAHAIATENIRLLQGIKGIGNKTAQRLVVDLKDKIAKVSVVEQNFTHTYNTLLNEAFTALVTLGFPKVHVEKVLKEILKEQSEYSLEDLIKRALKVL